MPKPGALERAGKVAGKTLRVLGKIAPAAAGVDTISNFNDYKINDPEVDSSAAGTFRALREGNYSGAGRSLSKGMLETGMDLGSTAAKTLDYLVPGKEPVSRAYNTMLRNQFGDQLIDNSGSREEVLGGRGFVVPPSVVPGTAPAQLQTQPTIDENYGNEGRRQPMTIRSGPKPGDIVRDGNSYSGTDVKFGADIVNPDGSVRKSNGFGVSVLGTGMGEQAQRNPALSQYDAEVAAAAAANQGTLAYANEVSRNRDVNRLRQEYERGVTKLPVVKMAEDIAARQQRGDISAQEAAGRIREAEMQNATIRRGQDLVGSQALMRDITDRRGQDLEFSAKQAANRLAGMRSQREQDNWQATYDAGRSDAKFTQQQQATKNLTDQIANWLPPVNEDGKQVPDQRTAARYAVAAQTLVGRMGKTMADLDDTDKSRLIMGMQLADIASGTATNGITPWGTAAIASNEPIMSLKKLPNGDYVTNRLGPNKEQEIIPARYVEKEGSLFGLQYFGKPSNRFAGLIQKEEKK
jgi:hypothetical protein